MNRALLVVALVGCVPSLDVDESVLGAPRVVAVRAIPAEAAPGERVRLTALYLDASGQLGTEGLEWAFCTARRPLAELGSVSRACLLWESDTIVPLGLGDVEATVPRDACRLFGPEPPPAEPGEPAGRVAEPDATGGYAIPVRVAEPDDDAQVFGAVRLRCGLAGATQAIAAEFRRRYRISEAPVIERVTASHDDGRIEDVTATLLAAPGERVAITVGWPACPESDVCGDGVCGVDDDATCADCAAPVGCGGAERYLRFEPDAGLTVAREAMRVAFFAAGGRFEDERVGRDAGDLERSATSVWIAPDVPGPGTLFFVIRDDRGGTGYRAIPFDVR